jgi:hypothetical protein
VLLTCLPKFPRNGGSKDELEELVAGNTTKKHCGLKIHYSLLVAPGTLEIIGGPQVGHWWPQDFSPLAVFAWGEREIFREKVPPFFFQEATPGMSTWWGFIADSVGEPINTNQINQVVVAFHLFRAWLCR